MGSLFNKDKMIESILPFNSSFPISNLTPPVLIILSKVLCIAKYFFRKIKKLKLKYFLYRKDARIPRQSRKRFLQNLTLEQREQFFKLLLLLIKDKQVPDSCGEVKNGKLIKGVNKTT